ncbi:MAG: hypothetical protein NTV45_00480 [Firmicutes bacterium]|nr:hypothetical protein [Bacillota bacterium]
MPTPCFFHDDDYKGMGVSEGLARGLQLKMAGEDLTQEGMGLGAIAIRSRGYTYFSRDCNISCSDPYFKVQQYVIDTVQVFGTGGRADPIITRISELLSALYRRVPAIQNSMLWAEAQTRRCLGIKSTFAPVAPQARADFCFQLAAEKIEVCCKFHALDEPPEELYLMNELDADFFTASWNSGRVAAPPTGWQVFTEHHNLPFLYSPRFGLRYSLRDISVDNSLPFKVCWGRERGDNLRWAGFAIQLAPAAAAASDIVCRYTIIFEHDHISGGI